MARKLYPCDIRSRLKLIEKYRTDQEFREQNLNQQGAKRHGISVEEYAERMARPCEVCGVQKPRVGRGEAKMHVDHDHRRRKLRGTLCSRCNRAIGAFGDDPQLLAVACFYLLKYRKLTSYQQLSSQSILA